jgi:hypothetical protein
MKRYKTKHKAADGIGSASALNVAGYESMALPSEEYSTSHVSSNEVIESGGSRHDRKSAK